MLYLSRNIYTFNIRKYSQACLLLSAFLVPMPFASAAETDLQLSTYVIEAYGTPPVEKTGALSADVANALDTAFGENLKTQTWGAIQNAAIDTLSRSEDARVAWLISDLMRIVGSVELRSLLADSITQLLGIEFKDGDYWGKTTNHLIAWDIPAPPNYLEYKRNVYTVIEPEWENLFTQGDIDWRHVSWGGVRIDNRSFDETDASCNCIPAADNPITTTAEEATWLEDEDIVFGIEVNGEYRAYPRQIMEVREMINDTLGGRDLGIPYCTLCGSAQAYLTDETPDGVQRPVLRTSGLLIRSNKVMYDVNTFSVFDTFRGQAVNGPLAAKNIKLNQVSVVTTEWGRWKKAYPQTTVLAESLALGRDFDFRTGRDANGPIFPIGDADPRLPVQEDVIGLITASGVPIAFPVAQAMTVLESGKPIAFENIRLVLDAGGVKAIDTQGDNVGSHQSFWFAWSQFHPETKLWPL